MRPLVSKKESTTPFIPSPPPFDVGIGKFVNKITDPLILLIFPYHDQDLFQEKFECKVKTSPLVSQHHINEHNLNLESDVIESLIFSRDDYHPISSLFHDPLSLDLLY